MLLIVPTGEHVDIFRKRSAMAGHNAGAKHHWIRVQPDPGFTRAETGHAFTEIFRRIELKEKISGGLLLEGRFVHETGEPAKSDSF